MVCKTNQGSCSKGQKHQLVTFSGFKEKTLFLNNLVQIFQRIFSPHNPAMPQLQNEHCETKIIILQHIPKKMNI